MTRVIIAAAQEEAYIGRALEGLSRQQIEQPTVVVNGPKDGTADIARGWGAHVIERDEPSKIRAMQAALRTQQYADRRNGAQYVYNDDGVLMPYATELIATQNAPADPLQNTA